MDSSVVAALAAAVSAIVAVLAWLGTRSANERANNIAANNGLLANEANRLAKSANDESLAATTLAKEANDISVRATEEARRSADAAEASLALQREEADAAMVERRRASEAHLLPICWESRAVGHGPTGLQVKNYGASLADQVRVYVRLGRDSFQHGELEPLGPDELKGIAQRLAAYHSPTGVDGIPLPPEGYAAARVLWRNRDGSERDTGWLLVPRY